MWLSFELLSGASLGTGLSLWGPAILVEQLLQHGISGWVTGNIKFHFSIKALLLGYPYFIFLGSGPCKHPCWGGEYISKVSWYMNVSKTWVRGGGAKCSRAVTGEGNKSQAKTGRKWVLHLSSQHLMSTDCVPGVIQGMSIKHEVEQNHVQSCHRQSKPWEQQRGGGVQLGFRVLCYMIMLT